VARQDDEVVSVVADNALVPDEVVIVQVPIFVATPATSITAERINLSALS
jgi:hypothetical protein